MYVFGGLGQDRKFRIFIGYTQQIIAILFQMVYIKPMGKRLYGDCPFTFLSQYGYDLPYCLSTNCFVDTSKIFNFLKN